MNYSNLSDDELCLFLRGTDDPVVMEFIQRLEGKNEMDMEVMKTFNKNFRRFNFFNEQDSSEDPQSMEEALEATEEVFDELWESRELNDTIVNATEFYRKGLGITGGKIVKEDVAWCFERFVDFFENNGEVEENTEEKKL